MKNLILACLLSIIFCGEAAGRLHPLSMLELESPRMKVPAREDAQLSPYIPALMLLEAQSQTKADLEALGVIFYHERRGIHLTAIPREAVNDVLQVPGIIDISCANTTSACMDKARPFCFVDVAQTPTSSRAGFTGKGIVTGISDIGFDPQHIAFWNNLKSFAVFRPENDTEIISQGAALADCDTDNPDQHHATHVANIMAGSYMEGLYYGVAPGSDLVVTTSNLNDVGILLGVEHIISYARALERRAVINLSLSSSVGPHDGSSLMSAYLNYAAEDAVICISSGNSGDCPGYAYYYFTPAHTEASVGLACGNNRTLNNYLELWGSPGRSFSVRCNVLDTSTGSVVYSSPWHDAANEEQETFEPGMLDGKITMLSYLCPMNNRYSLAVRLQYTTDALAADGRTARYVCFLSVKSPGGTSVQGWSDISSLMFAQAPGTDESFTVQCDGTVNDLTTAPGVICVGSCRSRNEVPVLSGGDKSWTFPVGTVSDWSSFASATEFCRPLPDFCAPGQMVISAQSSYFMKDHTFGWNAAMTRTPEGDFYWNFDQGTSMASPFAAGVFAQWLEADPTLTTADLREIAASTARTDFSDFPSAQWGGGCIDAEAGLEKILSGISSIAEVPVDAPEMIFTLSGLRLDHTDRSALAPGVYIAVSAKGVEKILVGK